jgi:hypothetical protein
METGVKSLERRQTAARERLEILLGVVDSDTKGPENQPHQYNYKPSLDPNQDTVIAAKDCSEEGRGLLLSPRHRSSGNGRTRAFAPPLQHAAVELLRGTMTKQTFIAYRDDRPGENQPITLDGDAWRGYVRLRPPWTLCIRDRAPPGSVAVLINRAHTYPTARCPSGNGARSTRPPALGHVVARTIGAVEGVGPQLLLGRRLRDRADATPMVALIRTTPAFWAAPGAPGTIAPPPLKIRFGTTPGASAAPSASGLANSRNG